LLEHSPNKHNTRNYRSWLSKHIYCLHSFFLSFLSVPLLPLSWMNVLCNNFIAQEARTEMILLAK
jgi:hypothetical protein